MNVPLILKDLIDYRNKSGWNYDLIVVDDFIRGYAKQHGISFEESWFKDLNTWSNGKHL